MDTVDIFHQKAWEIANLADGHYHAYVDEFERSLGTNISASVTTRKDEFGDGIYRRTLFMPAGMLLSSKKHRLLHPFYILTGAAYVISQGHVDFVKAPYIGMTTPGTRRMILIVSDCVWSACYPNPDNTTDLEVLESRIIEKHENLLLSET